MEDIYANMTRDELVAAGIMESESYRDFAPPNEDDPEAYDEMCRQDRYFS